MLNILNLFFVFVFKFQVDLEVPLDVVVVCLFVFNKGIALTRNFSVTCT